MYLPSPLYTTEYGAAYVGDSLHLLDYIEDNSIDLVMTSPPFALQREKEYGNVEQESYVDWLLAFSAKVHRVLSDTGSFVIDLGGAYQKGRPVRSLYNYRVLIRLCDELGFRLAEEFFWYNPAKLPSPIEWVNKRKIRTKDSVNTVWWLSKTDEPKADVRRVLVPYSDRMKKLHQNPERFYTAKLRPSGHNIKRGFDTDNGGSIPSNLLQIPNTDSNSRYIRMCKAAGINAHPARFPQKLPAFFIEFLTTEGDTILDIFAGSNTTGVAAEATRRQWIAFDLNRSYLSASAFRFAEDASLTQGRMLYERLMVSQETVFITKSSQLSFGDIG